MDSHQLDYIELSRIIMAKNIGVPPDDIDMSSILNCVARGVEERVKDDSLEEEEFMLCPRSGREMKAIVGEIGEKVIPLILEKKYPFDDFIDKYTEWYKENLSMQFLKMRMQYLSEEQDD